MENERVGATKKTNDDLLLDSNISEKEFNQEKFEELDSNISYEDFNFTAVEKCLCLNHSSPLYFFCLPCEEPICEKCKSHGPHNNNIHKTLTIREAVARRRCFLEQILSTEYNEKIQKILERILFLKTRGEEVSSVENAIENDIHFEYNGILDRLNQSYNRKMAILQKDISFLQRDISNIDDVTETCYQTLKLNDPVRFLLLVGQTNNILEELTTKKFKTEIVEYPYDLPRETSEVQIMIKNQDSLKSINENKNQVICKILSSTHEIRTRPKKNFIPEKIKEINEWIKICEKFSNNLEDNQLVCYFCSELMTENNINQICYLNRVNLEHPKNFQGYTKKKPKSKYMSNDRHFFHKPRGDLVSIKCKQYPTLSDYASAKILYENLIWMLKVELLKIKTTCILEEINFENIFEPYDKEKTGKVKSIQFKYVLSQKFDLDNQLIEKISYFFSDQNDKIDYISLIKTWNNELDHLPNNKENFNDIGFSYNNSHIYSSPKKNNFSDTFNRPGRKENFDGKSEFANYRLFSYY